MGNPSSTGIGQGAAQVFDTRNVLNTFVRLSIMEQRQRQVDEQNLANMMTQFDPSKLRAGDLTEFNDKYSKLQTLYTQNKGLYKNPLKHPDQYRQAQQLTSELRQLSSDSKNLEGFLSDASKELMKNKNLFSPQSIGNIRDWSALPTNQVKTMLGGRLPAITDLEYVPEEQNFNEQRSFAKSFAASNGAIDQSFTDEAVNEWENKRTERMTVKKDAIPAMVNSYLARPKNEQYADYQWRQLGIEGQNALRTEMAKVVPGIDLRNGQALVMAKEFYDNHMVLDEKSNVVPNQINIRADAERKRKEDRQFSLQREYRQDARADARASSGAYDEQVKDNMNITHSNEMLGSLARASKNPATAQAEINLAIAPLRQMAPAMPGGITTLIPGKVSKEEYVRRIMEIQNTKGAASNYEIYRLDEGDAAAAYDAGFTTISFILESKDNEGKITKTPYTISPQKVDAAALQPLIRNLGNKTHGFGQSFSGYSQTKKKVKK